jgi:cholesterol oxidase
LTIGAMQGEVERFKAVVVGSGFGGSVMAFRMAEAGIPVCVLERGKSYPPGAFARTPVEMARNFWDPSEGGYGLFQAWAFRGIDSIVSAGLGGGSLIYANVLIRKDEKWFVREEPGTPGFENWPVTRAELDPHYERVEDMLKPQKYPVAGEPYSSTPKTVAFRQAAERAGLRWELPTLAVTFANQGQTARPGDLIVDDLGRPETNLHGTERFTCRLVGECDIGCRYGSKNSLDYNYLTEAKKLGADVRTLCEVRTIRPIDDGYEVEYAEHDAARQGQPYATSTLPLRRLLTQYLILSAGVFGSTYLLLKNRDQLKGLSPRLGSRFSGNGDLLGFVRGGGRNLDPMFGPVITSTIRVDDALDGGDGRGFYIQEGGFPLILGWIIEAADAPSELRRAARLLWNRISARIQRYPKSDVGADLKMVLGPGRDSSELMLLLGMGRDVPDGNMSLKSRWLQLDWTRKTSCAYFDRVQATMKRIANEMDAEFTVNPLWYFSKLVTVHGLGGCPMARSAREGVVDEWGEVFNYPGLYVADGSVMPGPVGPNPSLTIAALSDRFASRLIERSGKR